MAVFGAPVAHEDDPERAVNAALRLIAAIDELNETQPDLELSVRAAVNTGEAVVTLGARPAEGEAMVAGDVVNTAARLQLREARELLARLGAQPAVERVGDLLAQATSRTA
jgi:class 3 adenylate cyclase